MWMVKPMCKEHQVSLDMWPEKRKLQCNFGQREHVRLKYSNQWRKRKAFYWLNYLENCLRLPQYPDSEVTFLQHTIHMGAHRCNHNQFMKDWTGKMGGKCSLAGSYQLPELTAVSSRHLAEWWCHVQCWHGLTGWNKTNCDIQTHIKISF